MTPSPGGLPPERVPSSSRSLPRPTPSWRFQPLSWEKLASVEAWLAGEGRWAAPEQRIEAELTLAEGRSTFALRDLSRGIGEGVSDRVAAARSGFRRVLSTPNARPGDRARATRGLAGLENLAAPTGASVTRLSRAGWKAVGANPARLTTNQGGWSRVTIHHSAEYAGLLRGKGAGETGRVLRNIQRYHMEQKGYGDIAYHFLIDPSGRVFDGRSLRWQGAHAGGSNNVRNIGICLLGDFDREAPTRAALTALAELTRGLRTQYGIAGRDVLGHGELKTTACPGRHLASWLRSYRGTGSRLAAAR